MFSWLFKPENTKEDQVPLLLDIERGVPDKENSEFEAVKAEAQSFNLVFFPADIIRIILSQLTVRDLNAVAATCKRMLALSQTTHLDEGNALTYEMLRNAMRETTQKNRELFKRNNERNNILNDLQSRLISLEAKKYYCRLPARINCGLGTLLATPPVLSAVAGFIYGISAAKDSDSPSPLNTAVVLAVLGMFMGMVLTFFLLAIATCAESLSHGMQHRDNESIANTKIKIATLQNQLKSDEPETENLKRAAAEIKSKAAQLNQNWSLFRNAQSASFNSIDHSSPGKQKSRLSNIT